MAIELVPSAMNEVVAECHRRAFDAGWWTDLATGADKRQIGPDGKPGFNVPEKLCLIHSEISEAMEGHRKDLKDTHLLHRKMFDVELADAVIRICDLAGAMNIDLGEVMREKLEYNARREDHKIENRRLGDGKKF